MAVRILTFCHVCFVQRWNSGLSCDKNSSECMVLCSLSSSHTHSQQAETKETRMTWKSQHWPGALHFCREREFMCNMDLPPISRQRMGGRFCPKQQLKDFQTPFNTLFIIFRMACFKQLCLWKDTNALPVVSYLTPSTSEGHGSTASSPDNVVGQQDTVSQVLLQYTWPASEITKECEALNKRINECRKLNVIAAEGWWSPPHEKCTTDHKGRHSKTEKKKNHKGRMTSHGPGHSKSGADWNFECKGSEIRSFPLGEWERRSR